MGDIERRSSPKRVDLADEPEFELGGLKVQPAERIVVMNGDRRELQPRVMQVLVALAQVQPAVVSREKLSEQCWEGRVVRDDALNRVIHALRHLAQEFTPQPFAIETVPRVGHRLLERRAKKTGAGPAARHGSMIWSAAVFAGAALLVASGIALLAGFDRWPWASGRGAPAVLVIASGTDSASRELARDLSVKLASLQAAQPTSLRLVGPGGRRADMALKVGVQPGAQASVVLTDARDGEILWSDEFKQPSRNVADLRQQVAIAAARVLGCASDALGHHGERLGQHTLKAYLNGCATLANLYGREAERVIALFRQVLKDAPRFDGAWAKLLAADMEVAAHTDNAEDKKRLARDAAAARLVNGRLAEVYHAQILLLPTTAYAERMRLADRAVELNPAIASAYVTRAQLNQMLGRQRDGIVDARRGMQLDPLSPSVRSNYILALAGAGLYDIARHELREAEQLWPGASYVAATGFGFNLRYGDPRQAWEYLRREPAADWMNAKSYLEARLDRSPRKVERAIDDAERLHRSWPRTIVHLIQVYGEFDREEDLLELLLRAPEPSLSSLDLTFRQPVADFWNDPRSLQVAKRAGMLDYWQGSGRWPDFCVSRDLPYDCRTEAAKLRAS